jgi:hypothetical protein
MAMKSAFADAIQCRNDRDMILAKHKTIGAVGWWHWRSKNGGTYRYCKCSLTLTPKNKNKTKPIQLIRFHKYEEQSSHHITSVHPMSVCLSVCLATHQIHQRHSSIHPACFGMPSHPSPPYPLDQYVGKRARSPNRVLLSPRLPTFRYFSSLDIIHTEYLIHSKPYIRAVLSYPSQEK